MRVFATLRFRISDFGRVPAGANSESSILRVSGSTIQGGCSILRDVGRTSQKGCSILRDVGRTLQRGCSILKVLGRTLAEVWCSRDHHHQVGPRPPYARKWCLPLSIQQAPGWVFMPLASFVFCCILSVASRGHSTGLLDLLKTFLDQHVQAQLAGCRSRCIPRFAHSCICAVRRRSLALYWLLLRSCLSDTFGFRHLAGAWGVEVEFSRVFPVVGGIWGECVCG